MKITYAIGFLNTKFEIRCKPLTYHFTKYIATKEIADNKQFDKFLEEVIKETEAECRNEKGEYSKNFDNLPPSVISGWIEELIKNSQSKVSVQVKSEKN